MTSPAASVPGTKPSVGGARPRTVSVLGSSPVPPRSPIQQMLAWAATIGVLGLVVALIWSILSLPTVAPGLYHQVQEKLPVSGSDSMVTAVLINFRGYDTLLELTVLLIAVLGVGAIRLGSREPEGRSPGTPDPSPLLREFIRVLAPILVVWAGYLLWAGGKNVGGAFQAGAVLGALGILLQLGEIQHPEKVAAVWCRGALVAGVAVFMLVGWLCVALGGSFLQFPVSWAGTLILLIEAAGTIAIGATLTMLFAGRSPDEWS